MADIARHGYLIKMDSSQDMDKNGDGHRDECRGLSRTWKVKASSAMEANWTAKLAQRRRGPQAGWMLREVKIIWRKGRREYVHKDWEGACCSMPPYGTSISSPALMVLLGGQMKSKTLQPTPWVEASGGDPVA